MPYGQQHYPFENQDDFNKGFPADFIAEGLDQTRGWFYTLTVLAVALFDSVAFKNCITTGMILAEDGRKMSKSLKNYPDPEELLNTYGGDSLRAYLINSPVVRGEPLKFSEEGVQLVTRNIILPLWNSFSFFSTYANADEITFKDLEKALPVEERAMMDRWIISSLQSLIKTVNEKMENYYLYEVIPPLMNFVEELTNWYVMSSRKRFWKEKDENDIDKINAFKTLHEVLNEFTKSMAPVLPFICEKIYQGLNDEKNESIHYQDYPVSNQKLIDSELENDIELAKKVIKSVRNLRVKLKLPNKQPLNLVKIVTNDKKIEQRLINISDLIKNEINVKNVEFDIEIEEWVDYIFKPDYKKLGPKLGKKIGSVANLLKNLNTENSNKILNSEGILLDGIEIQNEDIEVQIKPKEDLPNQDIVDDFLIYLDTDLNEELLMERFSREVVSSIQQIRKDSGLDVTDRIKLQINTTDNFIIQSITKHESYIKNETLSLELVLSESNAKNEILNKEIDIFINKLTNNS